MTQPPSPEDFSPRRHRPAEETQQPDAYTQPATHFRFEDDPSAPPQHPPVEYAPTLGSSLVERVMGHLPDHQAVEDPAVVEIPVETPIVVPDIVPGAVMMGIFDDITPDGELAPGMIQTEESLQRQLGTGYGVIMGGFVTGVFGFTYEFIAVGGGSVPATYIGAISAGAVGVRMIPPGHRLWRRMHNH